MITIQKLKDNLNTYLLSQINELSNVNPMMGFMKPIIARVVNNGIDRADNALRLIADKDGNIDIEGIITEMSESLINSRPFTINTSFIGDIVIGNGDIKIQIPYINKELVFNSVDLQHFKELLTTKV
jgi:hypothetical protein